MPIDYQSLPTENQVRRKILTLTDLEHHTIAVRLLLVIIYPPIKNWPETFSINTVLVKCKLAVN